MKLIFKSEKRENFTIEVGSSDTVLEIKEKVQKYEGIPVSDQILFFKEQILPDDGDINSCGLLDSSVLDLIIASDDGDITVFDLLQKSPIDLIIDSNHNATVFPTEVVLLIKHSIPVRSLLQIQMGTSNTIFDLKKTILELDKNLSSIDRPLILHYNGQELQDHIRTFGECQVPNDAEIDVSLGPSKSDKNLEVIVVSNCGTKRVPVAVNPSDNVGVIRVELENLIEGGLAFDLPPAGSYFFVHNEETVDDDKSFHSHNVGQRDEIHIFPPVVKLFNTEQIDITDIFPPSFTDGS